MNTTEKFILQFIVDVQNDEALAAYNKATKQVSTDMVKFNNSQKAASAGSKQFKGQIQNASYQLTDFIVQVQGGTSGMRAFSQQAPQLLAGFGAVGAAVGVVAAVLPAVIQGFMGAEEEAKKFNEIGSTLSGTIGRLEEQFGESGLTAALDKFSESFNKANVAMRRQMLDAIRADLIQAKHDITAMAKTLGAEVKKAAEVGGIERFMQGGFADGGARNAQLVANKELEKMADLLGTTTEGASAFFKLLQDINDQALLPEEVPAAVNELVVKYKLAGDNVKALREQVQQYVAEAKREEELMGFLGGGTNDRTESGGGKKNKIEQLTAEERAFQARLAAYEAEAQAIAKQGEALRAQYDPLYAYNKEMERLDEILAQQPELWREVEQARADANAKLNSYEVEEQSGFLVDVFKASDSAFQSFVNGVASGTADIKDAFSNMAKAIIAELLKLAAYKTIMSMFGGTSIGGAFGQATGATGWGSAHGNVVQGGRYTAFAHGGVVTSPMAFPMNTGMGIMAERGAEAIMPLSRMSGGDLGVKAAPVNVTVNNNAGVDVSTSVDGAGGLTIDIVRRAIAGDIAAGGNMVADAMAGSFALNRGMGAT